MDEQASIANSTDDTIVCYAPSMITTNGVWQGDNPLDYSLPLFILQLTMVVVMTRTLVFLLKPLRQPRVISEILGGVILGPSVLGRSADFANTVFPLRSVMVLETMANVGLLYFLFLVGVEMDLSVIRRTGTKAMAIAVAGMILPFSIGAAFSFQLHKTDEELNITYIMFLGIALSVTAFPVLARILAELKLINSEIGRMAMASALFNDMCAWVLLAIAIALSENDTSSMASLWVILSSTGFVLFCIFIVRPLISWMIRKTPEGESISEFYICLILTGVMISGFVTDALGTHSVFGAFVFGLVIPNGSLGVALIEKLEDFVSGLLLPLFFAISGLKTNVNRIEGSTSWVAILSITLLAFAGKIIGTLLASICYQMSYREGVTLGLLMNTKGLIEMIILNVGKDQKVLDDKTFTVMVIVALFMTGIITPVVTIIYRPTRRFLPYKKRTIQSSKPDSEFRVLVCIHTPRNVPTIINLLDASNPTKRSPICIYVLHLVELTGRASAMLIVHNTRKSGRPALNRTQAQSDHIINAFENYEQHVECISVQPLTAISPYSTMHEDICNLAEDKRVAFIIIPFHKQQTVDGGMEATNPAFRLVNQNVLANAPCSVGILVDRGLNGSNRVASNKECHYNITMLFFGGQDDREALSYAWRMSEHPRVSLTVMRFIAGEEASEPNQEDNTPIASTTETDADRERKLDEELIKEFRTKSSNNESISYNEKVSNNGEETVAGIRSMDDAHDLYIVGRGESHISPLTAGLTDWSECPELGAIGDLLASSDFAATTSVLVVQQFGAAIMADHGDEEDPSEPFQSLRSTNLRPHTPSEPQNMYST
ncbi:Cation/H(+) antiporter 15, partial [Cucurbita argyrosperma subsp. argyrosperma]|uniref:Cation/H(+) antiporter 15 n=1 Tax=Cucurbita moschata TaxID=3662 RepID=A0A6J1EVD4_CUCMO